MISDYHIHTYLCRHASDVPRAYVERAIELGMDELGFADHLPFLAGWTPRHVAADDWAMGTGELDGYVTLVRGLRSEYAGDIRILLCIEADYLEDTLDETARVLADYPFDYAIGSDHVIGDGFPFDHFAMVEKLPEYGIDRIFVESLGQVTRAAATGLFDVIGHLDQAKKYGYRPVDTAAVAAAAEEALSTIAAAGIALELNTCGWSKPAAEAYPAPHLLARARTLGIPITFGSDAHQPDDVGREFWRAAQAARAAGYATVLRLPDGPAQELPC